MLLCLRSSCARERPAASLIEAETSRRSIQTGCVSRTRLIATHLEEHTVERRESNERLGAALRHLRGCAREPVVRHLRAVAFRAMMHAHAGGRQRGWRAGLGLWRPRLWQREVSGVQHDDFPNAFLPPLERSA